jgi:hypothetical protein
MKFSISALGVALSLASNVVGWNDGMGEISSGYFSFFIYPSTPQVELHGEGQATLNWNIGCDTWTSLDSWLPWTLDVHPGAGICSTYGWDNTWVKYSNQFLNIPTDTRCGIYSDGGFARCIVAINP